MPPKFSLWTITPEHWQRPPGGFVPGAGPVKPKSKAMLRREEKQLAPFRTKVRPESLGRWFP